MGTTYKRYSRSWKDIIKQNTSSADNFLTYNYHIIRFSLILTIDKLTSRELYSYLILTIKITPSSNTYFENLFVGNDIGWKALYKLPRKTAFNTHSHFSIIF